MAAAPEPEFTWEKQYHFGWLLTKDSHAVMRVYEVPTKRSFRWAAEPWSGEPLENPPTFYTLAEAKTYCEVTVRLCGS